jgi:hypothetical protein
MGDTEMKKMFALVLVIFVILSCTSSPASSASPASIFQYEKLSPGYSPTAIYEQLTSTYEREAPPELVDKAKAHLANLEESILWDWEERFLEIDYLRTRDAVKLVDLFIVLEEEYLCKSQSALMLRNDYYSWKAVMIRPFDPNEPNHVKMNEMESIYRRLANVWLDTWGYMYPLLVSDESRKEIENRGIIHHYIAGTMYVQAPYLTSVTF